MRLASVNTMQAWWQRESPRQVATGSVVAGLPWLVMIAIGVRADLDGPVDLVLLGGFATVGLLSVARATSDRATARTGRIFASRQVALQGLGVLAVAAAAAFEIKQLQPPETLR